ncbi:MAG TPA: response regulator [Pirellulales bacterium]|nr:response regulator [Pirellulales bacterium]
MPSIEDPPTVFLVDDEPDVRAAAVHVLTRAGFSVEEFGSPEPLLHAVKPDVSGCYVLDLHLPQMSGLELRQRLLAKGCRQPFIILTGRGDVPAAIDAMKRGAADFLEKPFEPKKLLAAVQRAVQRDHEQRRDGVVRQRLHERLKTLTPRQRQVLIQMMRGETSKEIAKQLHIASTTVEVHRSKIVKNLGFDSLAEMLYALTRLGIT